ncbi:MAG: MBL fold metallo-hydrolase [Candidatus Omnitrophica bacterium]|nr:MBL fold metallo-hydrolase [Candidatus Omnitrophota bacterium]
MTSKAHHSNEVKRFVGGPIQTNCYVVHDTASLDGVLIDPGFYAGEITGYIRDKGIKILFTVNTHGHYDHITANGSFGYPVLIHESDRDYLSSGGGLLGLFPGVSFKPVEPAGFLKDGGVIDLGSTRLEIIHTPGHTPGCVSIKCGEVLFSGDTLFFEGVGRTDLPGGDHRSLVKSITDKLFKLPDGTKVLPGHGPLTTIGHEKTANAFL